MIPVKIIKSRFGTINIYPPLEQPSPDDEARLYAVLAECLAMKQPPAENEKSPQTVCEQVYRAKCSFGIMR